MDSEYRHIYQLFVDKYADIALLLQNRKNELQHPIEPADSVRYAVFHHKEPTEYRVQDLNYRKLLLANRFSDARLYPKGRNNQRQLLACRRPVLQHQY